MKFKTMTGGVYRTDCSFKICVTYLISTYISACINKYVFQIPIGDS